MAGDWIKIRCDLPNDPAVIAIASEIGIDEDSVVGKLVRIWSWADAQLRDGCAPSVTKTWLDRHISATGFAQAMINVGWLADENGGISIPKWDLHHSKSAKRRALASRRMQRKRCAPSATKSAPEKRREEKRLTDVPSGTSVQPAKKTRKRTPRDDIWDAVVAEWWDSPDTLTKADTSRIGKLVSALVTKKAEPADVLAMADAYRQQHPKWDCTPEAVLKHWDAVKRGLSDDSNRRPDLTSEKRYENVEHWKPGNA